MKGKKIINVAILMFVFCLTMLNAKNVCAAQNVSRDKAQVISLNKEVTNTLTDNSDSNTGITARWYRFTTTKNDSFYKLYGSHTANCEVSLELYDEYGQSIEFGYENCIHLGENTYTLRLTRNKIYYVKVSYTQFYKENTTFKFAIKEIVDDYSDVYTGAKKCNLNTDIEVESTVWDDIDYIKFKTSNLTTKYRIVWSAAGPDGLSIFWDIQDSRLKSIETNYCLGGTSGTKTVTLSKNKTYYIKFQGSDDASGKIKIVPSVSVSKSQVKKATRVSSKKIKVQAKKVSGAKGYEYQIASSKSKINKGTIKRTSKTSYTFKQLSNKKYYVRVRAYKQDSSGNKFYGSWSKVKTVNKYKK